MRKDGLLQGIWNGLPPQGIAYQFPIASTISKPTELRFCPTYSSRSVWPLLMSSFPSSVVSPHGLFQSLSRSTPMVTSPPPPPHSLLIPSSSFLPSAAARRSSSILAAAANSPKSARHLPPSGGSGRRRRQRRRRRRRQPHFFHFHRRQLNGAHCDSAARHLERPHGGQRWQDVVRVR